MSSLAAETCNGAIKSICQLLTCRCTSRVRSRRQSNSCRVSSTGRPSDIYCFEARRAKPTLSVCFTCWRTPRFAPVFLTCCTTEDQMRGRCCFRGAVVVCGGKCACEAIPALYKDQEGIHKREKIRIACNFMMVVAVMRKIM